MKNIKFPRIFMFVLLLLFPLGVVIAAQGAGSGGGSGGGGVTAPAAPGIGDQDQVRDRDQIRDPSTHDGTEPDQDRLQTRDQDRIMLVGTTSSSSALGQQNQVRTRAEGQVISAGATNTAQELRARIMEREQAVEQERGVATTSSLRNALQEQNRSRVAAQVMLDANALFGNRAEEADRVAAAINASVEQTVALEAKIQSRGFLHRFFMGGDVATAKQLDAELLQTRDRIQEMDRLVQDCNCDGPTRDLLQDQLRTLEQDRDRLSSLAAAQYDRVGLFGWLFR